MQLLGSEKLLVGYFSNMLINKFRKKSTSNAAIMLMHDEIHFASLKLKKVCCRSGMNDEVFLDE